MSAFGKTLEAIKRRRWEHIQSSWLLHLPGSHTPGTAPDPSVSELFSLTGVPGSLIAQAKAAAEAKGAAEATAVAEAMAAGGLKAALAAKSAVEDHRLIIAQENITGFREAIFWESLFLLHKARHVLGTAEFQVRDGFRTWSLANGYQGAFFAAKALLGFLGVCCVEAQNRAIIADVFPTPVTRSEEYAEGTFYYVGGRLDHRAIWELFQRVLAISVVEIWPREIVNKLKSVESKYFAKQRNDIHYKNDGWILDDLHDFDDSEGFGELHYWGDSNKDIDFERPDISVVLCIAITKLAYALVRSLEQSSKKLSSELEILQACIDRDRHPLYAQDLLS